MQKHKPHILILPRWYPNESDIQLGTFIQEQARLMAASYQVSVLFVRHSTTLAQPFQIHKTQHISGVNEVIVYFKVDGPLRKLQHVLRYRKAQKMGLSTLNRPIDLCHVHVPIRPAFLALKLKRQQGIPFIITEHWSGHLTGEYNRKSRFEKWLYHRVLKKAAALTTVSQLLQKQFKINTGFNSTVVPNLIQQPPQVDRKPKTANTVNLISVGDFNDHTKNITGLLKAFKQALITKPNLHLTLVGDGPDKPLIEAALVSFELHSSVTLAGRLDHHAVLATLPQYDFYVCSSRFETFGMTVAEALMAGLPVISTRCGGPEEFVNQNNGLLIPTEEVEALTTAIITMSNTYAQYSRATLSTAIQTEFGAQAVRQHWENLYNSILS